MDQLSSPWPRDFRLMPFALCGAPVTHAMKATDLLCFLSTGVKCTSQFSESALLRERELLEDDELELDEDEDEDDDLDTILTVYSLLLCKSRYGKAFR